ncbi:MAG: protein kinase [Candidatus Sumerlaeia bacterium]|nr:protein kinase [Candidatus Sumerlaeia bacterium]
MLGSPAPVLKTLVLTDLADSTRLTEALGDRAAAELNARVDVLLRAEMVRFGGTEIDRSDGFLVLFERPVDGLAFTLRGHAVLAELAAEIGRPLAVRAAVHLGEVMIRANPPEQVARGAKPFEAEGLAKPMAARIMALAVPGQTLLTRGAFDLARRGAVGEQLLPSGTRWLCHGPYSLKGVEDPVEVFEAGVEGAAPLRPPPDSEKAKSYAPVDAGIVLGWRPSAGADIPSAPGWRVLERLGEGGFGEVWRAAKHSPAPGGSHEGALAALPVGAELAFKFCFDLAQARAMRREATLFKMLQARFGEHPHIVRLVDFQLESAPLFLAMEYVAGPNLADWLLDEGRSWTPLRRARLLAPAAFAIAEIHDAGVLLNDIKPSNILVRKGEDGKRHLLLTDLGVGRLRDRSALADGLTRTTGFTQATVASPVGGSGSGGGTLLFLAPELLEGGEVSPASDAYAFGVTLMQAAAGNPRLAVSDRWTREVRNWPTRGLVRRLLRGDPARRLADFRRISRRIESLSRKTLILRIEVACAALVLLALLAAHVWWFVVFKGYAERRLARAEADARAIAVPITGDEYNAAHPTTAEGERAVAEAAHVFRMFAPIPKAVDSFSGTVPDQYPPPGGPGAAFLANWGLLGPGFFDTVQAAVEVSNSRPALERMLLLSRDGPPIDLLSWRFDPDAPAPLESRTRQFGQIDPGTARGTVFSDLRGQGRTIQPVWIAEALDRGSVGDAWERALAFQYYARAQGANATIFVHTMIGIVLEGLSQTAARQLFEEAPPGEAHAKLAAQRFDAASLAGFYERGFLTETLGMRGVLEFAAKRRRTVPRSWGGGTSFRDVVSGIRGGAPAGAGVYSLKESLVSEITHTYTAPLSLEALAMHTEFTGVSVGSWRRGPLRSDYQELEDEWFSQPIAVMAIPGTARAAATTRSSMTHSEVIRALALLRLDELAAAPGTWQPPERLDELFERHGYPPPRDWTEPKGTPPPLAYQVDADAGLVVFTITKDLLPPPRPTTQYGTRSHAAPVGAQRLDAVVASHAAAGAEDPWPRVVLRLPSGRELPVRVLPSLAKQLAVPDALPPGTEVSVRKRPRHHEGSLVFEAIATGDLAPAASP